MPQTRELLRVEVVTDDDTGIWSMGEFDFAIPTTTHDWLDDDEHGDRRRSQLAHFMHWLAVEIQRGKLATFRRAPPVE